MSLARLHWWMGLAAVAVFIVTGAYLGYRADVYDDPDTLRLRLRANHVYLLLAGLLNLLAGTYLVPSPVAWRRRLQAAGSVGLLLGPPLLLLAFVVEAPQTGMVRPLTFAAVVVLFLSVLGHIPGRPPA